MNSDPGSAAGDPGVGFDGVGQAPARNAALVIDVEGFEGPLDLLLSLARTQKVDLAKISILALAEQYLKFIGDIRRLRLEIAADYLVMAAWLAYLKSRLLLPEPHGDDEPSGEELAAHLAFRLQRLEVMRDAATRLMGRNRLGRDIFARGAPEPVRLTRTREYSDNLYDFLKAYSAGRQRTVRTAVRFEKLPVWTLGKAREILERLIGGMDDWGRIDHYILDFLGDPELRRSVLASSFSASLELVREGYLELRQEQAMKPLYMRRKAISVRAV